MAARTARERQKQYMSRVDGYQETLAASAAKHKIAEAHDLRRQAHLTAPELAGSLEQVVDEHLEELLYGSDAFKELQKGHQKRLEMD